MKRFFKRLAVALLVLVLVVTGVTGAFAAWVFYTPWGARAVVREIARLYLGSHRLAWTALDGSLARGIHVHNLQVLDIPRLPPGNILRVQTLSVRLSQLALNG